MATEDDDYWNPDLPIGMESWKPEIVFKKGKMIDGENYLVAHILYEVNARDLPNSEIFDDLTFLSIYDDYITDEEEPSEISSSNNTKQKHEIIIKKEPEENDKKTSEIEKKDQESKDSSKKKKIKNIKEEKRESPARNRRVTPPKIKKEKLVSYSRSPSPEVKVKLEPGLPTHLFGSYHCELCNITMNSELTLHTHEQGKKHLKLLKLKKMAEYKEKKIPIPPEIEDPDKSRYPTITIGCTRKKVPRVAIIQASVDEEVTKPCPGLNFVIEIHTFKGITYYCRFCDSTCSSDSLISHLNGFKHQLHSLKHFKPGIYEKVQYEPKYKIEGNIRNILYAVEKKEGGKGRLSVEIEELISTTGNLQEKSQPSTSTSFHSRPSTSSDYHSRPSTSSDYHSRPSSRGNDSSRHAISFQEKYDKAVIPAPKSSDYFCEYCQSHMNSLQMWDSHIRGKRHLTNLKKIPGDQPSKTRTVPVPNKRAHLLDRIKYELQHEPVVGLSEIKETEVVETNSHLYQCFMCGSCHTNMDIMEHIISFKHRTKYLEHVEFDGRELAYDMNESMAHDLVAEMCEQVQRKEGTGKPAVHVNKSAFYR